MSLLSFVKEAGEKLIDLLTPGNANASEQLKEHISKVGLGNPNVQATVDGDKVTVTGEVASQEEKEKILLAVGNIDGVGSVDDQITVSGPGCHCRTICRGQIGRHPQRDFSARVWGCQQVSKNLRGQQTDAQGCEQNLSGADAAYS